MFKQKLTELLLFKFGILNVYTNDNIIISNNDIQSIFNTADIASKSISIIGSNKVCRNIKLNIAVPSISKNSIISYLTFAAYNFIEYIDELDKKMRYPLYDSVIDEELSAKQLIEKIKEMPILQAIDYSKPRFHSYWEELSIDELIKLPKDKEHIIAIELNGVLIPISVDEAINIIKGFDNPKKCHTFYIRTTLNCLGYIDSAYKGTDASLNRIHLCDDTIYSSINQLKDNYPWYENNLWTCVLYHELIHATFGHKGNKVRKIRYNEKEPESVVFIINPKDEHEAQTYSTVLWSNITASKAIVNFSTKQPKPYQHFPSWDYPKENVKKSLVNHASSGSIKVGEIAKNTFRKLLESGKVSKKETDLLKSKQFGLNFDVLSKVRIMTNGKWRYYKDPVLVHGEYLYICSEFYEKNKAALELWILQHGGKI